MKLGNSRRDYQPLQRNEWQAREPADDEEEAGESLHEAAPEPRYGLQVAQPKEPAEGPARPEECTSVLGAGSTWQGTFSTEESVRLDGKVSGEVRAAGTVQVTEGAEVNATVHAKYVVIAGSFDGKIFCSERVELRPTSKMKGSVTTRLISVGEGAFIDGEIHMVDKLTEEDVARGGRQGDLSRLLAGADDAASNGHAESAPAARRSK